MEQRLNFSDYSAEEQNRDAQKHLEKKPHAFLLKVDGVWAHLIFSDGLKHKFYEGKTLIETYQELHETYPQYKVKYIMNKGLEDYLRIQRFKEQTLKKRQLEINFR